MVGYDLPTQFTLIHCEHSRSFQTSGSSKVRPFPQAVGDFYPDFCHTFWVFLLWFKEVSSGLDFRYLTGNKPQR